MSETRLKIAVFIDFDNIEIGVKTTLGGHFDVGAVLEAIKERGEVVTKIAYGDWTRAGDYSRSLTQHAIHMVQRNLTPGGDKNGADINLALDALEMAFTHNHINAFVIVGGDSDFMALVEKLKQYDRKVFVVGGRAFTSVILQKNCTEFIAYENLVGAAPRSKTGGRAGGRPGEAPAANAVPLIRRALKVLADREVSPQLGVLKSTLLQLDSTFSEREYGASTFRDFVQRLARAGYVTLKGTDRNIYVELRDGDGATAGAGVATGTGAGVATGTTTGGGPMGGPREGDALAAEAGSELPAVVEGEVVSSGTASPGAESGLGIGTAGAAGAADEGGGLNGSTRGASGVLAGDAAVEASGPELVEGEPSSASAAAGASSRYSGGRRGDPRFDRDRDRDRDRHRDQDRDRDRDRDREARGDVDDNRGNRAVHGGNQSGSPPEALRFIAGVFKRPGIVARWPLYLRQVKQILRSVDETFDERRYGFTGIVEALRYCQREGLFRLDRDRQGVLRVYPGPALQRATQAATAAPEAEPEALPVAATEDDAREHDDRDIRDRDRRDDGDAAEVPVAETLDLFPMSEAADAPSSRAADEDAPADHPPARPPLTRVRDDDAVVDGVALTAADVEAGGGSETADAADGADAEGPAGGASKRKRGSRRGGKSKAKTAAKKSANTPAQATSAGRSTASAPTSGAEPPANGGGAKKRAAKPARAAKSTRARKAAKPT